MAELLDTGGDSPSSPQVSIFIVAFNSRPFIEECLSTVKEQTRETDFEVLLIDNGTDGTEQLVREKFDWVRIVPSRGNVGFAAGNNAIAPHARGQYFLLLNPDTALREPAIDRLASFARRQKVDVAGGLEMDRDGRIVRGPAHLPSRRALLAQVLGKGRKGDRFAEQMPEGPVRAEVMSGCFLLIRRDCWNRLDGFDESFFLYSEEIDFFARLKAMGMTAWQTPEARIEHVSASGEATSARRMVFKHKGAMHYAFKHWGISGALWAGTLLWLLALQRMIINAALAHRSDARRALLSATMHVVTRPWEWMSGYRIRPVR